MIRKAAFDERPEGQGDGTGGGIETAARTMSLGASQPAPQPAGGVEHGGLPQPPYPKRTGLFSRLPIPEPPIPAAARNLQKSCGTRSPTADDVPASTPSLRHSRRTSSAAPGS